ncbi:MAG: ribbon-helix-helix domain-containing protein [Alkalinema sp. CAN_BIN05]|nr:ribbon-helix-helix domain-containing protein [Alkalinema sp. CAN_BIN05]
MSKKVSITLDDEILTFVDNLSSNRSSFINELLRQEKQRLFMKELEDAYTEQANDLELLGEIAIWDITIGDGLYA